MTQPNEHKDPAQIIVDFVMYQGRPIPERSVRLTSDQIDFLVGIGINPISREALARCVETEPRYEGLSFKIREDTSFDLVVGSGDPIHLRRVALLRGDMSNLPILKSYCGEYYWSSFKITGLCSEI